MKLTKYEHACFTVEKDNHIIVVDPGELSNDFIAPVGVVAVVLTHSHPDHVDQEMLASIIDKNPEAAIIGHADTLSSIETFRTQPVEAGDIIKIGPFQMEFFGGVHAIIHRSVPPIANLGVLINDLLYYPGDSLVLPGRAIDTLAVPAGGPWLKIGDAMDFLEQIKPRFAFPTHDAVLSETGKQFADNWLAGIAEKNGTEYKRLDSPITI